MFSWFSARLPAIQLRQRFHQCVQCVKLPVAAQSTYHIFSTSAAVYSSSNICWKYVVELPSIISLLFVQSFPYWKEPMFANRVSEWRKNCIISVAAFWGQIMNAQGHHHLFWHHFSKCTDCLSKYYKDWIMFDKTTTAPQIWRGFFWDTLYI